MDRLKESPTPSVMVDAQPSLKLMESLEPSLECSPEKLEQPPAVPTTTASADRNELGQLLPGVSGNPAGRPPGTKNKLISVKRKLELAVRESMSASRIARIISKMADMAEKGDVKAARLILDKFISSAGADDEDADVGKGSGITIRIENATFAKTQPPIEAHYTEIING